MFRKRYNVVIPTQYGMVIANHNDVGTPELRCGVFHHLSTSGTYESLDIELMAKCINLYQGPKGALDIGANIGYISLGLVNNVEDIKIFAFEAQRIMFQMLAGNMALNSIENVICINSAVGNRNGTIIIPKVNYGEEASFGSLEFGSNIQFGVGQVPEMEGPGIESAQILTIDSMNFGDIHFIKIDVEGMETEVVLGALKTIKKYKPIMFVEFLKADKEELSDLLQSLDYDLYEIGQNFLCLNRKVDLHREAEKFLE